MTLDHSDVKWIPDMSLYHSHQMHYDLLLDKDSRLGSLAKISKLGPSVLNPSKEPESKGVIEIIDNVVQLDSFKSVSESYSCKKCDFQCAVPGQLNDHMTVHRSPEKEGISNMNENISSNAKSSEHSCIKCDKEFQSNQALEDHLASQHDSKFNSSESICDDCSFQPSSISELIKHLSLTGHQPSIDVRDNRKVMKDFK